MVSLAVVYDNGTKKFQPVGWNMVIQDLIIWRLGIFMLFKELKGTTKHILKGN